MSEPPPEQLSTAGLARREAMLDELFVVMRHTHRAHRARRQVLAAGGCVCVLLAIGWMALSGVSMPSDAPRIAESPANGPRAVQHASVPQRRPAVTQIVQTDPSVLERYCARPVGVVVRMDDRTLLNTLASIDRRAGLIHFGEQVRLTRPVTDAELGLRQ